MRRSLLTWLRGWLRDLALFAVALAIGSTCLASGTLCVGDDGHVAIELAQGAKCFDDVLAAGAPTRFDSSPGLTSATPGSHCGPCTDLTATSGEWLAGVKLPQADPGPAFAVASGLSGALWPPSAPILAAPAGRVLAAHSLLGGTVLRC